MYRLIVGREIEREEITTHHQKRERGEEREREREGERKQSYLKDNGQHQLNKHIVKERGGGRKRKREKGEG